MCEGLIGTVDVDTVLRLCTHLLLLTGGGVGGVRVTLGLLLGNRPW